jgi:act minimal PKS acyl carrier protein
MPALTLEEFAALLRSCAGEAGEIEPDSSFADLGYDSLAMMEVTSQIERRYGISLPEADIAEAESPRLFIDVVNRGLATAAGG